MIYIGPWFLDLRFLFRTGEQIFCGEQVFWGRCDWCGTCLMGRLLLNIVWINNKNTNKKNSKNIIITDQFTSIFTKIHVLEAISCAGKNKQQKWIIDINEERSGPARWVSLFFVYATGLKQSRNIVFAADELLVRGIEMFEMFLGLRKNYWWYGHIVPMV